MKINEKNFVKRLCAKDEKALDYLIEKYGALIKAIVNKHLYNLENYRDECINDILLAVWNNIESLNEEKSSFKNWLCGVCRFKCIDYKRKYIKNIQYENIDDFIVEIEDESSENLLRKEFYKEINSLLDKLKKEDKDLFIQLYIKDKDIKSLAEEKGIKKDVIYNRISRGKRKLREVFKFSEVRG